VPTGNWNTKSDENHEIFFNFERWKEEASSLPMTKRSLLGLTAKIFDPLGYLAPLTIPMKVLFHVLCTNKVDWGEELTGGLVKKFQAAIRDIKLLHSVRTLRCYFDPRSKPINVELHGFSDALIHAYSAVVYLKSAYENGTVQVRLVASKTRVAPLKPHSLTGLREQSLAKSHQRNSGSTISQGEIVIVKNETTPRAIWKLARVEKLLPERDENIRAEEIKLGSNFVTRRPLEQLVPIEVKSTLADLETGHEVGKEGIQDDDSSVVRSRRTAAVLGERRRQEENIL
jgi:hypothetical protein